MMADAIKPLPCPFCGEPGKLIAVMGEWQGADKGYGPRGSRGVCSSEGYHCTAMAPSFHGPNQDADALAAWNRRASPPAREEAPGEGAALRTQAPDSWRPDREAVGLLEQWVDAFEGLGSGSGPLINATRSYLALRPQTAESGE